MQVGSRRTAFLDICITQIAHHFFFGVDVNASSSKDLPPNTTELDVEARDRIQAMLTTLTVGRLSERLQTPPELRAIALELLALVHAKHQAPT